MLRRGAPPDGAKSEFLGGTPKKQPAGGRCPGVSCGWSGHPIPGGQEGTNGGYSGESCVLCGPAARNAGWHARHGRVNFRTFATTWAGGPVTHAFAEARKRATRHPRAARGPQAGMSESPPRGKPRRGASPGRARRPYSRMRIRSIMNGPSSMSRRSSPPPAPTARTFRRVRGKTCGAADGKEPENRPGTASQSDRRTGRNQARQALHGHAPVSTMEIDSPSPYGTLSQGVPCWRRASLDPDANGKGAR
jgi:hypothetical protein